MEEDGTRYIKRRCSDSQQCRRLWFGVTAAEMKRSIEITKLEAAMEVLRNIKTIEEMSTCKLSYTF